MLNEDGSITPSYITWFNEREGQQRTFSDYSLKVGKIVAVYFPTDSNNVNKKFTEYDVEVNMADGYGPSIRTVFYRAVVSSAFGGIADYTRWTPRKESQTEGAILGSLVMVLCQNGNQRKCFITGGIPHPETSIKDEESHSFVFEFNGINFKINKDGEFILKRRGATDEKGEVSDTSGENSFMEFRKTGDIAIGYLNDLNTEYVSLELLKAEKVLKLFAKNNIESKTEKQFVINTNDGVKINPGNLDSQAFLRGTTFRQNQQRMHNSLKSLIQSLSTAILNASTALGTGGANINSGAALNATPMYGGVLALPNFQAAGAAFNTASVALSGCITILNSMVSTIDSFEAGANSYLSTHHFFGETP